MGSVCATIALDREGMQLNNVIQNSLNKTTLLHQEIRKDDLLVIYG